jgi:hypothetical protein
VIGETPDPETASPTAKVPEDTALTFIDVPLMDAVKTAILAVSPDT